MESVGARILSRLYITETLGATEQEEEDPITLSGRGVGVRGPELEHMNATTPSESHAFLKQPYRRQAARVAHGRQFYRKVSKKSGGYRLMPNQRPTKRRDFSTLRFPRGFLSRFRSFWWGKRPELASLVESECSQLYTTQDMKQYGQHGNGGSNHPITAFRGRQR